MKTEPQFRFAAAIFCALVYVLAFAQIGAARAAEAPITMQGWVTSPACDARAMKVDAAACMRKCNASEQLQFVDDAKHQVWDVSNPKKLNGFASSRVTLHAIADSAHKKLQVISVKKIAAQ